MAGAVAHLHARSIIHDDVKPENIVWSPEHKHGVLVDFGAALNRKTLPEGFFNPSGTPPYAPPEFLQKQKVPGGDIWSLGVAMLFCFRYIRLPDGEWLLPAVWDDGADRLQMLQWLESIDEMRKKVVGDRPLLSEMLAPDPAARIDSLDLRSDSRNEVLTPATFS